MNVVQMSAPPVPGVLGVMVKSAQTAPEVAPDFVGPVAPVISEQQIYARTADDELIRINTATNKSETIKLPSEYLSVGSDVKFVEDGESLEISRDNGKSVERVKLDDLFSRGLQDSTSASSPHEDGTSSTRVLSPKERFVPIDYKVPAQNSGAQSKFQDLLFYDRQSETVNRFPFALSQDVEKFQILLEEDLVDLK